MTTIAIDGLSEEEFRRSIESGLRRGRAGEAVAKLRELIEPFAGEGRILPARFLTVDSADLALRGWEELGDRIRRYDRPGRLVSAISIAFGWPGEDVPQPDAEGRVSPLVEVGYYNDDAFPFSRSGREDLLDGYSFHGCTWGDDCVGSDTALVLEGISDLHGALAALETRLLSLDEPDPDEICAGSLGACLLSALLYQAVSDRVAEQGLPRPLCVMAGSNGVYPYFDAPVAGMPMEVLKAATAEDEGDNPLDTGVPGPRYSSLAMTGIKRAPKRAVLVLQESDDEMAVRIANLRGLAQGQPDAAAPLPVELPAAPEPPEADEGIIDLPISPLMTKKPHGQGWDFRDMLSPRDPAMANDAGEGFEPEPVQDFADWDGSSLDQGPDDQVEPDEPEEPVGFEPVEEADVTELACDHQDPVEPGFALIENNVQQRLQSLLAGSLPSPEQVKPAADLPEVEKAAEECGEPTPLAIPAAELAGAVWPLGFAWADMADEAEPLDETPVDSGAALAFADELDPPLADPEEQPREPGPSLWSRLRAFFALFRRAPAPERTRKIRR